MRVRVELVLRGQEPNGLIDIYEVFPTGGVSGDWNSTHDGVRYLFPARMESGYYRVTRDFWRSIYPVYSGCHDRLPLDQSRSFWERFALMQWWVQPDRSQGFGQTHHTDPGNALGDWRLAKILRGLLRHPDKAVRMAACEDLMHMLRAQDECWDSVAPEDRKHLDRFWNALSVESVWEDNRRFEQRAHRVWSDTMRNLGYAEPGSMDALRLFTTVRDKRLRQEFCELFLMHFSIDRENGCPASSPPPATIVTENGDVPLLGPWLGSNVSAQR
ncbi:MAG: hypothetical protein IT168_24320 [Bryobacterales bacterium]|nr:hypothetical protein [Bryobacterales bacterium]